MNHFKDDKGRKWNLRLTYDIAARIEDELGYLILSKPTELQFTPQAFVEIAWMMIEKQAESISVTPTDFGESLTGDCLMELTQAVLGALSFFLRALSPQASLGMRLMAKAGQGVLPKLEECLDQMYEKDSSKLPDLLASILRDSPDGRSFSSEKAKSDPLMELVREIAQLGQEQPAQ